MSGSRDPLGGAPPAAFVEAIARAEIRRRRRLRLVALSLLVVPVGAAAAFLVWGKEDATDVRSLKRDVVPLQAALSPDAIEKRVRETLPGALPPVLQDVVAWGDEVRGFPGRVKQLETNAKPVADSLTKIDAKVKEIDGSVTKVKALVGDEPIDGRVTKAVANKLEGVNAGFNALKAEWTTVAKVRDIQDVKIDIEKTRGDVVRVSDALGMQGGTSKTLVELRALASDRTGTVAAEAVVAKAVAPLKTDLAHLTERVDKARDLRQQLGEAVKDLGGAVDKQGKALDDMRRRIDDLSPDSTPGRSARAIGTIAYVDVERNSCTVAVNPGADVPPDALLAVRKPPSGGALVGYVRLAELAPDDLRRGRPPRPPTRPGTGFGDSIHHVHAGDIVEVDGGGSR